MVSSQTDQYMRTLLDAMNKSLSLQHAVMKNAESGETALFRKFLADCVSHAPPLEVVHRKVDKTGYQKQLKDLEPVAFESFRILKELQEQCEKANAKHGIQCEESASFLELFVTMITNYWSDVNSGFGVFEAKLDVEKLNSLVPSVKQELRRAEVDVQSVELTQKEALGLLAATARLCAMQVERVRLKCELIVNPPNALYEGKFQSIAREMLRKMSVLEKKQAETEFISAEVWTTIENSAVHHHSFEWEREIYSPVAMAVPDVLDLFISTLQIFESWSDVKITDEERINDCKNILEHWSDELPLKLRELAMVIDHESRIRLGADHPLPDAALKDNQPKSSTKTNLIKNRRKRMRELYRENKLTNQWAKLRDIAKQDSVIIQQLGIDPQSITRDTARDDIRGK